MNIINTNSKFKSNSFFFLNSAFFVLATLSILGIYMVSDLEIYFSFIPLIISISIAIYMLRRSEFLYFEVSLIIFYILFFVVAPFYQIKNGLLPNTMPINIELIMRANLYLTIFLLSYLFFRFNICRKRITEFKFEIKYQKFIGFIMLFIFLFFLSLNLNDIVIKIINKSDYMELNINNIKELLMSKYIFFFPIFLLIFKVCNIRKSGNISIKNFIEVIILLLLIFIVKNPFVEKRNSIGPLYIAIGIFLFYNKRINIKRYFIFMFIIMIIFFPLASTLTHSGGITNMGNRHFEFSMTTEFISLNYDAWSNFMGTIDFVDINGITYGKQLIGSVLFFIPRSLWISKPISTGALIGNYLMGSYGMWFNNLSNPFPSEGYINFGLIGIVFFAFILSSISRCVEIFIRSGGYLKFIGIYIATYMIFFMRGDLMNGFAYGMGFIAATVFTPLALDNFIKSINRKE
ncbi:MAG: O-antigen polysaccharide polymerase Wzy [Paeniclostridium sordellii]|nr:O-antigen polysaccharide polymerase Wzy [Paeniclostridium sordellii]